MALEDNLQQAEALLGALERSWPSHAEAIKSSRPLWFNPLADLSPEWASVCAETVAWLDQAPITLMKASHDLTQNKAMASYAEIGAGLDALLTRVSTPQKTGMLARWMGAEPAKAPSIELDALLDKKKMAAGESRAHVSSLHLALDLSDQAQDLAALLTEALPLLRQKASATLASQDIEGAATLLEARRHQQNIRKVERALASLGLVDDRLRQEFLPEADQSRARLRAVIDEEASVHARLDALAGKVSRAIASQEAGNQAAQKSSSLAAIAKESPPASAPKSTQPATIVSSSQGITTTWSIFNMFSSSQEDYPFTPDTIKALKRLKKINSAEFVDPLSYFDEIWNEAHIILKEKTVLPSVRLPKSGETLVNRLSRAHASIYGITPERAEVLVELLSREPGISHPDCKVSSLLDYAWNACSRRLEGNIHASGWRLLDKASELSMAPGIVEDELGEKDQDGSLALVGKPAGKVRNILAGRARSLIELVNLKAIHDPAVDNEMLACIGRVWARHISPQEFQFEMENSEGTSRRARPLMLHLTPDLASKVHLVDLLAKRKQTIPSNNDEERFNCMSAWDQAYFVWDTLTTEGTSAVKDRPAADSSPALTPWLEMVSKSQSAERLRKADQQDGNWAVATQEFIQMIKQGYSPTEMPSALLGHAVWAKNFDMISAIERRHPKLEWGPRVKQKDDIMWGLVDLDTPDLARADQEKINPAYWCRHFADSLVIATLRHENPPHFNHYQDYLEAGPSGRGPWRPMQNLLMHACETGKNNWVRAIMDLNIEKYEHAFIGYDSALTLLRSRVAKETLKNADQETLPPDQIPFASTETQNAFVRKIVREMDDTGLWDIHGAGFGFFQPRLLAAALQADYEPRLSANPERRRQAIIEAVRKMGRDEFIDSVCHLLSEKGDYPDPSLLQHALGYGEDAGVFRAGGDLEIAAAEIVRRVSNPAVKESEQFRSVVKVKNRVM